MKLQIDDLAKAFEWIELFKFIKQLNQYVTFMCKEDQLYIQLMDDSHICLIDITIPSTWFTTYESSNQTFSVFSSVLVKIFAMYTADTLIDLEVNDDNDKLKINLKNKKEHKCFEINLMDIEKDLLTPAMPDTKMDFVMNTKTFDKYIHELASFGDEVIMFCKDEKLYFKTCGDEGTISIEIEGDNLDEFSVVENYEHQTRYCLKYLIYISKLYICYKNVHIYVDEQSPMVITFDDTVIKIKYYLAPKCDDNE
uniref:Proliferating cell nuclear antigen PCNA N-terminal domain-containing protein n=1 Tax=viral metagenome TaxID=1070528 RepID=A0A6C0ETU6_9ZZZZ